MIRILQLIVMVLALIVSALIYCEIRKQRRENEHDCGCGGEKEEETPSRKQAYEQAIESGDKAFAQVIRESIVPFPIKQA